MEGARTFFQGLPQSLGQSAPAESPKSVTEKDGAAVGNHHPHPLNRNQLYHPSVITANHHAGTGSSSASANKSSSSGSGSAASINNINNNNNISSKDSSVTSGVRGGGGSIVTGKPITNPINNNLNHTSVVVGPGQKSPANTSGKSGNSASGAGVPAHSHLHRHSPGFGSTHSQHLHQNSQSHVPIHVPLTIPLPNHHQQVMNS